MLLFYLVETLITGFRFINTVVSMLVCVINHSLALHPMAIAWDILVWNTDTHEQINKLVYVIENYAD